MKPTHCRACGVPLTRTFVVTGKNRVEVRADVFNLFNSNAVLVMTTRYAATNNVFENVAGTGILAPRVLRLGVQTLNHLRGNVHRW